MKPIIRGLRVAAVCCAVLLGMTIVPHAFGQANLAIGITNSASSVLVNNNITLGLLVTNLGPSVASNVVVTNFLPSNFSFVSANISGGGISTQRIAGLILTNAWKYDQSGTDLGTAWREPEFDDGAWPSGAAGLFLEPDAAAVAKNTPLVIANGAGTHIITYYFRTTLAYAGPSVSSANLYLRYEVDDGAVFYLNGVEVHRFNMPSGTISSSTTAIATTNENTIFTATVPITNLVVGDNTIAAEVHQVNATSSDVFFAASVDVDVLSGASYNNYGSYQVFNLGNFNNAVRAAITLVAKADEVGSSTNVATVGSSVSDTTPANNRAQTVLTVALPPPANLAIGLSDYPDPVQTNMNTTYTLVVTNLGPATATNVVVTNMLPFGFNVVTAYVAGASMYTQSVDIVEFTNTWKYDQSGADLGTAWRNVDFDDSVWPEGPATLGFETATLPIPTNTVLNLINESGERTTTFYFRSAFQYSGPVTSVPLTLRTLVDDAAIIYLNGVEIFRSVNMPTGAVDYLTQATNSIEASIISKSIVLTNLMEGTNILAAEVHQNGTNSSDIVFALALGKQYVTQGNFSTNSDGIIFNLGNMNANAVATMKVVGYSSEAGVLTNFATVGSLVRDNNLTNNSVTATTTVSSSPVNADVSVTISHDKNLVPEGWDVTYSITVRNSGPIAANNVKLTNSLPVGFMLVSVTPSAGSCSTIGTATRCDLGKIEPNGQVTVVVVATANYQGIRNDIVRVGASELDFNLSNNAVTNSVEVITGDVLDLRISSTDSPDPVTEGEFFTNRIAIFNAGPSNATGIIVTNRTVGNVTMTAVNLLGAPDMVATNYEPGELVCNVPFLESGATAFVDMILFADRKGMVTNRATVASDQYELVPGNNISTSVTTIKQAPYVDLVVSVVDTPSPVSADANLLYTVFVRNDGNLNATNVWLTNFLDRTVAFLSLTNTYGISSNFNGLITCRLGNISGGATSKVQIVVKVPGSGTLTNWATAYALQRDYEPSNNMVSVETVVLPPTSADLVLRITPNTSSLTAGQEVSYRINLTNNGPLTATSIIVSNRLPAGMVFLRASSTLGTFYYSNGAVIFNIDSLPKDAYMQATFVCRPEVGGNLAMVSTASADQPDPAINKVTTITRVKPAADLVVSVKESMDPVSVGQLLIYTVTVINNGPSTATGGTLFHYLPSSGVSLQGFFTETGEATDDSGVVIWYFGTLVSGASATLDVTVQVDAGGTLESTFGAVANEIDPLPGDNDVIVKTSTFGNMGGKAISITPNTSANALAAALTSGGATGIRVTRTALAAHSTSLGVSSGLYSIMASNSYGLALPGVVISTGSVMDYETGPNIDVKSTSFGTAASVPQESLLDPITSQGSLNFKHNDVTQLDIFFDMMPNYNQVSFKVVFGSEEYPEFINEFIDGFGIYLDGKNIAKYDGLPININHPAMTAVEGTELNGVIMTGESSAIMQFSAPVVPGSSGHKLTFIVADTIDTALDTTVFISSLEGAQGANADLAVTGTVAPNPVRLGTQVTYSLTVSNFGPYTATNTILKVTLPDSLEEISVEASQGEYELAGKVVTCNLGTLERRESATVMIAADPTRDAKLLCIAEVYSDMGDLIMDNNVFTITSTSVEPGSYVSPATIIVQDGAIADPYPSVLTLSGIPGVVEKLTASFLGVTHSFPGDISAMLEAPNGQKVILMAGAGGSFDVNSVTLKFDDAAPEILKSDSQIVGGTYRPSNLLQTNFFPGLGNLGPITFSSDLSAMRRVNPNGDWKLYVYDQSGGDAGVIDGWNLKITTVPVMSVTVSNKLLVVSWSDIAGYALQSASSLAPGASWTTLSVTPVVGGGKRTVTVPIAAGSRYFRLRK